jgi:hypothetical protein
MGAYNSIINIDIEYLPGSKNLIADLLSRRPKGSGQNGENQIKNESKQIDHIDSTQFDATKFVNCELPLFDLEEKYTLTELDTKQEQSRDENISLLMNKREQGTLDKTQEKSLIVTDDILYYMSDVDGSPKLRLYRPEHLVDTLVTGHHNFGHLGIDKTYENMKRRYYFPNMYKRVYDFVSKCITCQERNLRAIKPPMGEMDIPRFHFLAYQTGVSVSFTHAGIFIWHGGSI